MSNIGTQAASALKMARAFSGMDQTEFADAIGRLTGRKVRRAMVSNWERYYASVPLEVLLRRPSKEDVDSRVAALLRG